MCPPAVQAEFTCLSTWTKRKRGVSASKLQALWTVGIDVALPCFRFLSSKELIYLTWGKGKIIDSKMPGWDGIICSCWMASRFSSPLTLQLAFVQLLASCCTVRGLCLAVVTNNIVRTAPWPQTQASWWGLLGLFLCQVKFAWFASHAPGNTQYECLKIRDS